MNSTEYGENYSDHLLEQYKLYVEMADRISHRRDQSNRFYSGLLAGMIALMAVLVKLDIPDDAWVIVFFGGGLFGSFLSAVWFVNIRSYRSLNEAKFTVINELEKSLPAQGYTNEENLLRPPGDIPKYFQLTTVEQLVPVMMFLLFVGLSIYSALELIP